MNPIPSILEVVGKVEKPRFSPPEEISDILTSSMNDTYKVIAGKNIRSSFPKRESLFTESSTSHDIDIDQIYQSPFLKFSTQNVPSQWWLPDWFQELTVSNQPISYSRFSSEWNRFLSYLTPGGNYDIDSSLSPLDNPEVRQLLHQLYSSVDAIDFSSLLEKDELYQGSLTQFNVYQYTTSQETIVWIIDTC